MDFPNKTLDLIFERLQKEIFEEYSITFNIPLSIAEEKINSILLGSLKYFTTLRNGYYYTEINIKSSIDFSKEKRDLLVSILKKNNVEMIAGSRMKIAVKTRSFAYNFRHYVKSKKTVNKFNL